MPESIEQFTILVLGALAAMFVITLAAKPWAHTERIPILALFLSLVAVFVSGATIFFTVFWHHADFRVYFRFPEPLQVGTNTLDVNYFFSNMGNQAVLIEDVFIDELWINSNSLNIGNAELYRCDEAIKLTFWPPEIIHGRLKDGSWFATVKPTKIYIDGTEARWSSATVEAGKMKVISATYITESLRAADYNTVVICPMITLFDSKGQPVLAVCKGWQSSDLPRGGSVAGPPAGGPPARLLPVASRGTCLTVRTSAEAS
jgi:hypothetical protein